MISIVLFIVGLCCTCGAIYAAFGVFRSGAAARDGAATAGIAPVDARKDADRGVRARRSSAAAADLSGAADIAGAAAAGPAAAGPVAAGDAVRVADAVVADAVVADAADAADADAADAADADAADAADTDAAEASAAVAAGRARPDPGDALDEAEVFSRLHALALGVEQIPAALPARHEGVLAAVASAISSGAAESRYAMRRPRLLPQLLHAMNDDETNRRELARIISQDPALVGNLLKLANSALYRISPQPVESIDRAVAVLGTDGIRSLVAAAMMQPVFRPAGGRFASFPGVAWEHTFRSAAAAEAHAAFAEKTDRFAAQLLGLLMGLGAIVVFRIARDRYSARKGLKPDPAVVAAALEANTADTARRIAAGWKLSDRILEALQGEAPRTRSVAPTPLGRSLRFGRLIGAVATLHAGGVIDAAAARASVSAGNYKALPDAVTSRLLFNEIASVGVRRT
ncbi:MAG: HDOD domain-containing protein [Gammaproteobacteria bacterium]|nr:HDOD domain-containing protein [Gammaproteobacteria bacterium]